MRGPGVADDDGIGPGEYLAQLGEVGPTAQVERVAAGGGQLPLVGPPGDHDGVPAVGRQPGGATVVLRRPAASGHRRAGVQHHVGAVR